MTRQPVFVIHGVANTDEPDFLHRVTGLEQAVNAVHATDWAFVPVYWNQSGADVRGVEAAIPPLDHGTGPGGSVRGGVPSGPDAAQLTGVQLFNAAGTPRLSAAVRGGDDALAIVQGAAVGAGDAATRGGTGPASDQDVRAAIEDAWQTLTCLPDLKDADVLEAVGRLVASAVADAGANQAYSTRGFGDDLSAAVARALQQADLLTGAVVGRAGEVVLHTLRTKLTPSLGKGMGDVLIYQDQPHRQAISSILREALRTADPTLGTAGNPARVIGHSLGGIIAFDLAVVSDDPVHWERLITFGSQSAMLHVLSPRGGAIGAFDPASGSKVALPQTIGAWTNIWEPWDQLAFVAGRVFELHGGGPVVDLELPHRASTPLWTHSIYWEQPEAAQFIADALR